MTKKVKRRVSSEKGAATRYKGSVRQFKLGSGLPTPEFIRNELAGYRDVLMGREDPPIDRGVMTLYEVAEGYFSRACEIEQLLLEASSDGLISKESPYHTIRTQEIRSFKEMAKSAADLGSRRVTWENILIQKEVVGRESM